jgi:polysaccharide export outer membrane protein
MTQLRINTGVRSLVRLTVAAAIVVSAVTAALPQIQSALSSASDGLAGPVDYRLNLGDVLEISIHGFPELRQKAMVELNGDVSLPPAGRIRIVGMNIAEAQAAIRKLVTARPLRQKFADGRENLTVVAADDVSVSILEYRPVYVTGDVAKPGELVFRPGLTVRQAIALAGGFDIMRYRLVNPFIESADMKGKQESLWTEIAKVRAEIARVRAELDGNQSLDESAVRDIPLAPSFIDQLVETEAETLKGRLDDFAKDQDHLKSLVQMAAERAKTLAATVENEEQGVKEDEKGYADLGHGAVSVLRMMDIRHTQIAGSTRVLQARWQLEQAQRDAAEATRNLEHADSARRTELLTALQTDNVKANDLQAQLSANSEKLSATSLLKSRLVRGPGAKPTIQLFRSDRNLRQVIDAVEETSLLPGDTIDIALKNEFDLEVNRELGMVRNALGTGTDPVRRP